MQVASDDSLNKAQNHLGQFWEIHPPIPTWNQDTYQETWKDPNQIIYTKRVFII